METETMRETTYRLTVRATIDGTPVEYKALPIAARSEDEARAYLETVMRENRYRSIGIEVVRSPSERAD